jgi:cyanosortase A-associated protein
MNIIAKQWRSYFLAATGIGVSIVAAYTLIIPSAGDRSVADFVFPQQIPLNTWQQQNSRVLTTKAREIKETESDLEIVQAARSYNYIQNQRNLAIEMRYLVGTVGDSNKYIQKYTNIPIADFKSKQIENIEEIGYHALFTSGDRAYLSSCIIADGDSNVNPQQFSQQLGNHSGKYRIWLDWLQGKASIRDRRCLWTNLSISFNNSSPQLAYQTLETAWVNWYRWWEPRFPKL